MLRAKERSPGRPLRPARTLSLVLLTAVALAVSALRGSTQKASPVESAQPQPPRSRPSVPRDERIASRPAPYDLSFLPAETRGVIAVRPARLFALPGMKKYAVALNNVIAAQLKEQKISAALCLPVEEIEQMICPVQVTYQPKNPRGQRHAVMLYPVMIRATHDFDWKKPLRALSPTLKAISHAGGVYYQLDVPGLGPKPMYALIPDARTVVFGSEAHLRQLVDRKKPRPRFPWLSGWERVERDLVAGAGDSHWLSKERDTELDPEAAALVRNVDHWIGGMGGSSPLQLHAWAVCPTATDARLVAAQLKQLGVKIRRETKTAPDAFLVIRALLDRTRVEQQGSTIEVRSELEMPLAAMVQYFLEAQ